MEEATAAKEPMIITDKAEMRRWTRFMRAQPSTTIALVPTMDYLHEGHLSLIKAAHHHSNLVVVSIYVGPGQFSASHPNEDLCIYPLDFHGDLLKLKSIPGGVDVVFHPKNLYGYDGSDCFPP